MMSQRRWGRRILALLILIVVGGVVASQVSQGTSAFPPSSVLRSMGVTLAPARGSPRLTSQEAMAAAATAGLQGPEGSPRLATVLTGHFAGLAYVISSAHGKWVSGTVTHTATWVVAIINAHTGAVVRILLVNPPA